MIKIEHVVLPSAEQMDFIIEGMRNPMNSWDKSDSGTECSMNRRNECMNDKEFLLCEDCTNFKLGENDQSLMQRLSNAGTEHRKYMRMMPVYARITAPLYWWKEFDTYKVGTVANSCSTMHKIMDKEFVKEDFSLGEFLAGEDWVDVTLGELNELRDTYNRFDEYKSNGCLVDGVTKKDVWYTLIQILPNSYNQTRNVMMNYEVLANIYRQRKDHKLDCWRDFCKWIETLPYSYLITGEDETKR